MALAIALVVLAAFAYVRTRPAVSDEELAAAHDALAERKVEFAAWTPPPRAALGDAAPIDQASFDAFFDDPRWTDCFEGAGQEDFFRDVTDPASGAIHGYQIDRGDGASDATPIPDARYVPVYGPPMDSPEVREVERTCEGLGALVERFAATPDLRSPYQTRAAGLREGDIKIIQATKAIAVVARRRAREGRPYDGLRLLALAQAVARDLRKGPVSLITAMLSVAAEGILMAHASSLLLADPALSAAEYEELRAMLRDVRAIETVPRLVLLADRESFVQEVGDAERLPVVVAAHEHLDVCEGEDVPTCIQTVIDLDADASTEPDPLWAKILGPRIAAGRMRRFLGDMLVGAFPRYLRRVLQADVDNRMLEAMLTIVEARSAHPATCPPPFDPAALEAPFADDPMTLTHFDGETYELAAPELPVMSGERTVVYFGCPAAVANWALPDGTVVPDPRAPPDAGGDAEP